MSTDRKKTDAERIAELEAKIKLFTKERNNLMRYVQFKGQMDDTATRMAIIRDSFINAGFTEDQAFELILKMLQSANK